MKTTAKKSDWDVSFWFAISSPLLGVLVAILALAIFCRWSKQRLRGSRKKISNFLKCRSLNAWERN